MCLKAIKDGAGPRRTRGGEVIEVSEEQALREALDDYDMQGETPLCIAMRTGNMEIAKLCLMV